jgi:hypothetical protein
MAVFGAPSTHEDDPERHGQALLGLGRCATRLGRPPAREPLLQARQIFARLGAGELLAETDGWLDGRGGPGGMVGRP